MNKKQIIKKYGKTPEDSGNVKVQIVLLTSEINKLNEHMKKNKNDVHNKKQLLQKIHQRRRFLNYYAKQVSDEEFIKFKKDIIKKK